MKNAGITFIELIVVMGIFSTLFALVSLNFLNITFQTTLNSSISPLIADLQNQKIKAMVGETQGQANSDSYGIYFFQTYYTMFKGDSYNANDPTNSVITLDDNLSFTGVTLPQSQVIFSKGSGEIVGFSEGTNTFSIQNTNSNESKTVTINRLGVITGVN